MAAVLPDELDTAARTILAANLLGGRGHEPRLRPQKQLDEIRRQIAADWEELRARCA
jgi:hypothetical protein